MTPTPSQAATRVDPGILEIEAAQALPNPNPDTILVKFLGTADHASVRIFTKNMACIHKVDLAFPPSTGWMRVPLPPEFTLRASNGTYYFLATGKGPGAQARRPASGKILILR